MNIHEMVRAYLQGESLTSLARKRRCKTSKVRLMLRSRGVHIRDQAEAVRTGIYRRLEAEAARTGYRRLEADDKQCRFLPTPEEIEERKAEIRATWSEEERASRLVQDYGFRRFSVRVYRHNGVDRCQYSEVG